MKQVLGMAVWALAAVLAVAGCQHSGGPSDDELITETLAKWSDGMKAKDAAMVLSVVSEHFTHPEAADKAAFGELVNNWIEMGWLEELVLAMDAAERERAEGSNEVYVYPIDAESLAGVATIGLTLTKEGKAWLITGMDLET